MRSIKCIAPLLLTALAAWASFAMRPAVVTAHQQQTLSQLLTIAQAGRDYLPAAEDEVLACENLFQRTLRDPRQPDLANDWRKMGFQLIELTGGNREIWVIVEPPESKRGWGFYVLCPRDVPRLVLQAPHSYADLHTGDVALRLFEEGRFTAAAWNTVPRKQVDVAHWRQHPFSAFTQALIVTHPEVCIVQLHGFAQDKRKTIGSQAADLIVSNGTHFPDPTLHQLVARLQSDFPFGSVELFPIDVRELGATQNVQGELLRRVSSSRFIHLEMSQDLRLRLIMDPRARQALLKNLDGYVD